LEINPFFIAFFVVTIFYAHFFPFFCGVKQIIPDASALW